jgi:hypothetical protein
LEVEVSVGIEEGEGEETFPLQEYYVDSSMCVYYGTLFSHTLGLPMPYMGKYYYVE